MDYIINDYLDSVDSAAQYDAVISMADDFVFGSKFKSINVEQFNDLPF